jgi:predicted RNA-binding protein with TRAM domain
MKLINEIDLEVPNLEDFGRRPPVEVGDVRKVKIEAIGSSGDGIARISGFVVFVPGTKVDDEVTVRVTKVLRKYAFAEVVE